MLSTGEQLLIILAASVLLMLLLWFVQRLTGDAGIVDVGWSYALGASGVFAAVIGSGDLSHRVLIGLLVGVWGARLGTHILTDRVLSGGEDGRYAMLRERVGDRIQPVLFVFYQFQALLVPILSVPFVYAASAGDDGQTRLVGGLGILALLGALIWVVSILGESLADRQLKQFKKKPDSKGKTCREGLWRYSRHPNYFFEWLMWVGYALIALEAPGGWWGLIAPALMLVLILKVTGIPPTEARAVKSRGEDYKRYQRTTSAFFPWPPREEATDGDGRPVEHGRASV
jgi:steroid 5-alpha reductase family enzyme